ncbi:hypothetical protein J7E50_19410 [Pedobacter sp. ISL-68]|uniref:hypothetical protein n=1 Tax=unclassified Pedobacter TaxID=2628915 RepID=UPI001BE93E84|nr:MULTISPECIES: hypothetical protein [unclassified Pedobacter]MBT2564714.1 hypothetical protein [Pedobacter sp. ISL-64]MBT2592397.1 hypothetical protein [Pedobacter sp. ISL-68]
MARYLRDKFDFFWKNSPSERGNTGMAYYIRHSALLQCFDSLAGLEYGGMGTYAASQGVEGPLLPLTTGDQIEKLNDLLIGHQNNIKDIFSLHQDPVAMGFLEHELAHITNVLQDFVGFLNDFEIIPSYQGIDGALS